MDRVGAKPSSLCPHKTLACGMRILPSCRIQAHFPQMHWQTERSKMELLAQGDSRTAVAFHIELETIPQPLEANTIRVRHCVGPDVHVWHHV